MQHISEARSLRAYIGKIVTKRGVPAYMVAYPEIDREARAFGLTTRDSITFHRSLLPKGSCVAPGQVVFLKNIVLHAKGWRATEVELVTASAGEEQCVAQSKNA
jgi:hypothetical protein